MAASRRRSWRSPGNRISWNGVSTRISIEAPTINAARINPRLDPVSYFLKTLEHNLLVDSIYVNLKLVVADRVEDLVNAAWQFFYELF